MNLGNLVEKGGRREVYCALCRSKDKADEIGQLTKERKTRKEISLSTLRGIWCWELDDRSKEIKPKRNRSLTMSSNA